MIEKAFKTQLINKLIASLPNWYGQGNWDAEVLAYRESSRERFFTLVQRAMSLLSKDNVLVRRADLNRLEEVLANVEQSWSGLATTYLLLQDEYSRSLLINILAHRQLGYRKVKLPINTPDYWAMRKFSISLVKSKQTIKLKFRDYVLRHMDLHKIGFPLEMFFGPAGTAVTFILKQYEYQKITPAIKAQAGDVVIDAGGGWGDTALYFAHTVGQLGKVFSFEFSSDNLEVFKRNLEINPEQAKRIEVIQRALWDKSGEEITYSLNGPATSLQTNSKSMSKVTTVSIDDFIREKGLSRVNYIKMDIEGAELKALRGAEETLRCFRPRLAISLYHRDKDFIEIPQYLENLNLGYRFYLDHFTVYRSETILFADY